jgi:toxin-antitoxin system PIN domain toxin
MIAIDTNILVYAMREDSPWHGQSIACVRDLAEGASLWAIPWPCVHEFLAIVTHPRIYMPPTPLADAILQVDYWMESPTLRLIGESAGYWGQMKPILLTAKVAGPKVHDARIAAICRASGVSELWTADRDFSRFPGMAARNPLIPGTALRL